MPLESGRNLTSFSGHVSPEGGANTHLTGEMQEKTAVSVPDRVYVRYWLLSPYGQLYVEGYK